VGGGRLLLLIREVPNKGKRPEEGRHKRDPKIDRNAKLALEEKRALDYPIIGSTNKGHQEPGVLRH